MAKDTTENGVKSTSKESVSFLNTIWGVLLSAVSLITIGYFIGTYTESLNRKMEEMTMKIDYENQIRDVKDQCEKERAQQTEAKIENLDSFMKEFKEFQTKNNNNERSK